MLNNFGLGVFWVKFLFYLIIGIIVFEGIV